MDSDWILIFKMKQGNDLAWEHFIRKYYGDILKYCFFHCPDKNTAEDLTQEVFLRFVSSLSRYEHMGKAKNYLYTIAANLCKSHFSVRQEISLEQAAQVGTEPLSEIDDRLILDAAVHDLPEEFREIILLHYYQGLKLTEVAAVLNIGLPLVKYRLKRARELLRKELCYGPE